MKTTNIMLTVCVIALAMACFFSIGAPLRFDAARTAREADVKRVLLKIRTAEQRFRSDSGFYAPDFKVLVARGYLPDSLQYIPHSGGKRFHLSTATAKARSGQTVPVMECAAGYDDYLGDLDRASVDELARKATEAGQFAGLKIGDTAADNGNAANWEQ